MGLGLINGLLGWEHGISGCSAVAQVVEVGGLRGVEAGWGRVVYAFCCSQFAVQRCEEFHACGGIALICPSICSTASHPPASLLHCITAPLPDLVCTERARNRACPCCRHAGP